METNPGSYYEETERPFDYKHYFYLFKKNFHVVFTFFVITVTLSLIYVSKIANQYEATAQLIVERPRMNVKGAEDATTLSEPESLSDEYYSTQIEMMKSNAVLKQVVDELKLTSYYETDNDEMIVEKIRKIITVSRLSKSRLFEISAKTNDPKFAANLANAVAGAYVRKNFEDLLYYSKEILAWLPQEGENGETITIKDPSGTVKQMTREELIESLPSIRTDPTIRELREKKNSLMAELDLLLKQYKEKHPLIIKSRANIKFIEESIAAEKTRIVENLKSKASGTLQVSLARIVEQAQEPKGPIPSNRPKIVMMATGGQLLLSFLIIFLLDYFDATIHSMEDLEKKGIVLPFLGPIPLLKQKFKDDSQKALASYYEKQSELGEAFRYLRVAINFSSTPESLKNLVISSCLPHEGKSFISDNIAVSFAMDGNKTLLVDADLRRPTLHRIFKFENTNGLSNYLTSNLEFNSVLKETFVENLMIVPSGPISPNPGEILGGERMKLFLNEARKQFDRIIIDCPPLTGIGDGLVVGSLIGHMTLVIAAGKTPSDLIQHTHQHLLKAGIKVIGVVLNMVDLEKERYHGYSKYYYNVYNRYYQRKDGE